MNSKYDNKFNYIKQNKIRNQPKGWIHTNIGEILELNYGKGLPKRTRVDNGNIPVYGSNGIVGHHNIPLVNKKGLIIGRKGTAGSVHISKEPFYPIDTTYFIEESNNLSLIYTYYLLISLNLNSLDKSTAIPGLNRNDAYSVKIPLPPLAEQYRIVEKIEEEFTRLDAGVSALKRAKALIPKYRQSVLKAAMCGDLTKEWRALHPDVEINKEDDDNLIKLDNNNNYLFPKKWTLVKLNSISNAIGGYAFKSNEYSEKGHQIIKIGNVKMGRLDLSVNPTFISKVDYKIISQYLLNKDDILVTLTGTRKKRDYGNIVKIKDQKNLLLNQRVGKLVFTDPRQSHFYFLFFQTDYFRDQFFESETGNVGQGNVSMKSLKETIVPLPPLEEQHEIVSEIERRFSIIDEMERIVEESLLKAERLRQSVLKKAFEGRLVSQNPDDEPAGVLLERIRAEKELRAADGKKKK
ncbi:MAG: restriction endonuclease subunit S [Methanomicrobiaceae archaeon]|nr:restriction endonuclease subunit S [Methanomicrobiaceae archaeon]